MLRRYLLSKRCVCSRYVMVKYPERGLVQSGGLSPLFERLYLLTVGCLSLVELATNLHEVVHCLEKAPTRHRFFKPLLVMIFVSASQLLTTFMPI